MTPNEKSPFRVWPDGTVQSAEERCLDFMSDDYAVVQAVDEEEANHLVNVKPFEQAERGGAT